MALFQRYGSAVFVLTTPKETLVLRMTTVVQCRLLVGMYACGRGSVMLPVWKGQSSDSPALNLIKRWWFRQLRPLRSQL